MKSTTAIVAAFAALCMVVPCAAPAAEEPELVYAKFHRAVASGNLAEMAKYGPDARRAELAAMSDAQKDATLKMIAMMMPRAFTLRSKLVNPDGRSARLVVSGPGGPIAGGKPETLYGTIRMVVERGEWKVDESDWSNAQPRFLATPKPAAPPPAADKAALKAAATAKGAPMVGSMSSGTPVRKLGEAKAECVYKPVMTDKDMENCK